jgi:hypothetical protein
VYTLPIHLKGLIMADTLLPLVRGDSIKEADYRDNLPQNMYTVMKEIRGAKGYLINHPGLTKTATGEGVDRGAYYSGTFNTLYRVSGQRLIEVGDDGTVTNLSGNVGDDKYTPITGNEYVRIAQSFNNLAIVADGNIWYYNPTKGLRQINVDLPDEETPPTSGKLTYSFTGSISYQADRTSAGFESIDENFNGIFKNIGVYGYLQDDQEPEQTPPVDGQLNYELSGSITTYQAPRTASGLEGIDPNFNGDFVHLEVYGYIQDSIWNKLGTAGHTRTSERLSVYYKQKEGQDDVAIIVRYVGANPQWFVFSDSSLISPTIFLNNDTFDFGTFDTSVNYTSSFSKVQVESPITWNRFGSDGHTQTSLYYAVYYKQTQGEHDVAMMVKYTINDPQWFIFTDPALSGPQLFQDNDTVVFQGLKKSEDYTDTFSSIAVTGPNNVALFGNTKDIIFTTGVFMMTDGKNIYHTEFSNEERVDPLAFATAEFLPDETVGLGLMDGNTIIVFGRFSTEFYVTNPSDPFGFTRVSGQATKSGLIAVNAKVQLGGNFFILGGRADESIGVRIVTAGSSQSVATREIEKILETYTKDELAQAKFDAVSKDGTEFLYISLSRDTLLYNHTVGSEAGLINSWTVLKSTISNVDFPWVGVSPVYDRRISKFVFGDRFTTDIGIMDDNTSRIYGQRQECILYTPFLSASGQRISQLEVKIISGFTTKEDKVFLSKTVDGEIFTQEYISDYGGVRERSKRLIWRRGGFIRDYTGFKIRMVLNGRVAFGVMEVDFV